MLSYGKSITCHYWEIYGADAIPCPKYERIIRSAPWDGGQWPWSIYSICKLGNQGALWRPNDCSHVERIRSYQSLECPWRRVCLQHAFNIAKSDRPTPILELHSGVYGVLRLGISDSWRARISPIWRNQIERGDLVWDGKDLAFSELHWRCLEQQHINEWWRIIIRGRIEPRSREQQQHWLVSALTRRIHLRVANIDRLI